MSPGAKKGVTVREELGLMVQKKKGRKGICKQLSEVSHSGAGRGGQWADRIALSVVGSGPPGN